MTKDKIKGNGWWKFGYFPLPSHPKRKGDKIENV